MLARPTPFEALSVFGPVRIAADTLATYISTHRAGGQAIGLVSVVALVWLCVAATGCAATGPTSPGGDEFVGHPDDGTQSADLPPRRGALWYRLQPRPGSLDIRIRLLDPPSKATFFLPGPWAGHGDFDERIEVDAASDAHGSLPMAVDRARGRIDVDAGDGDWLELAYRVDTRRFDDASRFAPHSNRDAFFAYAPTILVLPSAGLSDQLKDIPVEVHTPPSWTVTATWPQRSAESADEAKISGFVADDIRTLRDAFVGGGDHWRRIRTTVENGGNSTLVFTDEFAFDVDAFARAAEEIISRYREWFGVYDELSAVVMPPRSGGDVLGGTGRRGGFVLEVPRQKTLDDELLLLLAHEALHMWNGHHLVPDPHTADDTTWFKEGVTHYAGLKTLSRIGLIDPSTVRRELARAGQYYLHNPAIAGGRIRAIDRARLPYDRGVLIALAIDHELYEHTDGELSIVHWLKLLTSEQWIDDSSQYDVAVLRDSLAELVGEQTSPVEVFDDLVHGTYPIDVVELFGRIGLHFLRADPGTRARLLPIDGRSAAFDSMFIQSTTRKSDE